jgi:uncharacterized SAM-binding protein YcdF (DUF218 family)
MRNSAPPMDSPLIRGLRTAMRTVAGVPTLLGLGVIVLFVGSAFTPIANVLAESVAVRTEIAPADAIVVLAAGGASSSGALSDNSLRRAIYGIDLGLKGLAPLLVFSGSHPDAESSIRAHMAQEFGVSPQRVLTSSGANTTREEAVRLKGLLWPRGVRTILLVTDADHMIRAAPVFTHAGFRVFAAPANEPEWDLAPGDRLDLLRGTLRELVALLYYKVAGYL